VWDDSDVQGLLQAFPYLKLFGVSDKRLIYKFDFNGARFIFLWTGKYDYRSPSSWDADRPQYEAQMKELRYARVRSVLEALKSNPALRPVMIKAAEEAEEQLIAPLLQFRNRGEQLPFHWSTISNEADFVTRTAVARSNKRDKVLLSRPRRERHAAERRQPLCGDLYEGSDTTS
jgi:hypothetical protein